MHSSQAEPYSEKVRFVRSPHMMHGGIVAMSVNSNLVSVEVFVSALDAIMSW